MELTVRFRHTGGRALEEALDLARKHPTFATSEPPVVYSVRYDQDELQAYDDLMAKVGRLAQTQVLLGGVAVDRRRLDHLLACYRARLSAPDRRSYCQGRQVHETGVGASRQLFPCRLIPISEGNHGGWFQYGRLTRDGTFLVDKGQLRAAVADAAGRALADHCPAFFSAEVDAVVDALPQRIHPQRDAGWAYREGWHNGRFVAVGVEKLPEPGRSGAPERSAGPPVIAPDPPDDEGATMSRPEGPRAPGRRTSPPTAAAPAARAPAGPATPPSPPATRPPGPNGAIAPVRYADIGGLAREVRIVRENVELPMRHPELFAHLGITPHRGLLLAGPPGTGKTLLAKALAHECEACFLSISGPEIISKWHGESEANLRRIFEDARDAAPAVILIDEIDAIAPDRGMVTHNHEAVLVSQLLTLMDGLQDRGDVVVVATTNRPERLDPALRRPGRLDLVLQIALPDLAARAEILRIHTGRMPLHADVDLGELAAATEGYAGAHLGALCREAGLQCVRDVVVVDEGGGLGLPEGTLDDLSVRQVHFRAALQTIAAAADPRAQTRAQAGAEAHAAPRPSAAGGPHRGRAHPAARA